jgi:hypothetical protein
LLLGTCFIQQSFFIKSIEHRDFIVPLSITRFFSIVISSKFFGAPYRSKRALQDGLEAVNQLELDLIDKLWCTAKYYARENCKYTLEGLRETVSAALDSVSTASIHRFYVQCMRILNVYAAGIGNGTAEFREHIDG